MGGAAAIKFVEAMLWIARTGSPWRDLPETDGTGIVFMGAIAAGQTRVLGCK